MTHPMLIHTAVGSWLFIAKWKEPDPKTICWRIHSRKGTTIVTETTSECPAIGGVDRRDILGTMEMFQAMIMLEVTWMHTFVPTCRIVDLKYVHFVVHEIDFNKVGWKRSELDCAFTPLYNLTCFLSNSILAFLYFGHTSWNSPDTPGALLPEGLSIGHYLCHRCPVPLLFLPLGLYSNVIFGLRPFLKTLSKMSNSLLNPNALAPYST